MPSDPSSAPDTLVTPSLKALLAELIDYAGLFPPAGLPLDEAVRNYARYRSGPEAWMLARFVLPVGRLDEMAPYADLFAAHPPFRFSVLGTGAANANAFLEALTADLDALRTFHRKYPGQVRAEAMEVRLPPTLLGAAGDTLRAFLNAVGRRLDDGLPGLQLFFEVPLDDALQRTGPPLLAALAALNEGRAAPVGFKMRTGGLEPADFPDASSIAFALTACRDAGVPFKATAGLHHPVRRFHEGVRTHMYGFFNVFGGAVLAHAHPLDEATLRAILLDDEAAHFHFTDEAFVWQHLAAPLDAIDRARTRYALSFGSCSFDEPRDDLRALGLL